jgi:hypothetical protein
MGVRKLSPGVVPQWPSSLGFTCSAVQRAQKETFAFTSQCRFDAPEGRVYDLEVLDEHGGQAPSRTIVTGQVA